MMCNRSASQPPGIRRGSKNEARAVAGDNSPCPDQIGAVPRDHRSFLTSRAEPVALAALTPAAWNSVAPQRRSPMQYYLWAQAYEATLARHGVYAFVVGELMSPQAIAPFAIPRTGSRRHVLLGAEDLWESVEVAWADEAALEALAEKLAASGLSFRFGHYPTDTPFLNLLHKAYRGRGLVVNRACPRRAMPRIELDSTWSEPESHFSSRRPSRMRRKARIASELGKVCYDIIAPTPPELPKLMDEAFAVEERNWKSRSGTALSIDRDKGGFYRLYAKIAAEAGILRLCFLRIGGVAAAMQIAVECDNRFWTLKIGYDESFNRCSPGILLMRETIKYAAERGLASYEFLGKEAPWTELWTKDARPVASVRTYAYNFSGFRALLGDTVELARRRLSEKFKVGH